MTKKPLHTRRRRSSSEKTVKEPMSKTERAKKKLIWLSWWLLEQKLKYYHPQYGKAVSDEEYDKNEELYKKLCKHFKQPTTACESVGFPWNRPCAKLIVEKVTRNKK